MSVDWADDVPSAAKTRTDATEVFLAWERLRVVYNLVLVVVVLTFGWRALSEPDIWPRMLAAALFANLCFCAGMVGEGYLTLLGFPRQGARHAVFAGGTLFASFLAVLCISVFPALNVF